MRSPFRASVFTIASLFFSCAIGCRSDGAEQVYSESYSEASHSNRAAGDYDLVFGNKEVHRIDLTIEPDDFVAMQRDVNVAVAQKLTPMWVEATVRHGDFVWDHVGIRYRGRSAIEESWEKGSKKFPFKLTFDRFEEEQPHTKNQRFYGFKKLSFSSGSADDSLLREVLASEALKGVGVATARAAFYRVFVDGGEGPIYWGLYTALEDPDDEPLQVSQFGSKGGNLYKPEGRPGADWVEFRQEAFLKENHEDEADYGDVQAAVDALHSTELEPIEWRAQLESLLDVDSFLRSLAVNTTVVNWDSYGCKARNYFLYAAPEDGGRLAWIPSDLDESFKGNVVSCGSLAQAAQEDESADIFHENLEKDMPLISLLLADPVYRERYTQFLEEAVQGLLSEQAFRSRATELHELVEEFVVGSEGETSVYSNLSSKAAFNDSLSGDTGLFSFMEKRRELVSAAIEAER